MDSRGFTIEPGKGYMLKFHGAPVTATWPIPSNAQSSGIGRRRALDAAITDETSKVASGALEYPSLANGLEAKFMEHGLNPAKFESSVTMTVALFAGNKAPIENGALTLGRCRVHNV